MIKTYLNNSKFISISYSFYIKFLKNKHFTIGFLNPGSLGTRHEKFVVALESRSVDIMKRGYGKEQNSVRHHLLATGYDTFRGPLAFDRMG